MNGSCSLSPRTMSVSVHEKRITKSYHLCFAKEEENIVVGSSKSRER